MRLGSCSQGSQTFGSHSGALDDADERKALVVIGGLDDVEQHLRYPVHRLRDERHVLHPECHAQRLQRLEVGPARRGVALGAARRGRRGLHLGQTVDLVIVQEHRHVHVVADGVDPVRRADAAAVAVAGVDEDLEVGPREPDALGNRQCDRGFRENRRSACSAGTGSSIRSRRRTRFSPDAVPRRGTGAGRPQGLHCRRSRCTSAVPRPGSPRSRGAPRRAGAGIRSPSWSCACPLFLQPCREHLSNGARLDRLAFDFSPAVDVGVRARSSVASAE